MGDLMRNLLSIVITVGLSDRESFVKSVSGVLEEHMNDPARAEKISVAIIDYLQQVKNNINTQASIKNAVSDIGFADKKSVTELTKAVEDLTIELRSIRHKE